MDMRALYDAGVWRDAGQAAALAASQPESVGAGARGLAASRLKGTSNNPQKAPTRHSQMTVVLSAQFPKSGRSEVPCSRSHLGPLGLPWLSELEASECATPAILRAPGSLAPASMACAKSGCRG